MILNRRNLKRWVQLSIEVCSITSREPFRSDIETGKIVLFCPAEVIDLFKRKRVLSELNGKLYFEYLGAFGITFVEVQPDPKVRTGLFLEKKAD